MNRGDGPKSRSITVNEGGDEGCPMDSDAGLMAVEQLIMEIAAGNAQAIPATPLMYGEFAVASDNP
jgi:hypothetical protein